MSNVNIFPNWVTLIIVKKWENKIKADNLKISSKQMKIMKLNFVYVTKILDLGLDKKHTNVNTALQTLTYSYKI